MDISLEYIKMCGKAAEIQRRADYYVDDFSVKCWHAPHHVRCKGHFEDWNMNYKFCPVCSKSLEITPEYCICRRLKGDDPVWLPRQDQLQEMIIERTKCSSCKDVALAYMFHSWMTEEDGHSFGFGKAVFSNPSMEQLWLAFVMKEKHRKFWNGEEWK